MSASGSYVLHVYCDAPDHVRNSYLPGYFDEFAGRNSAESYREARRWGWRFKRDGTVLCPRCAKDDKWLRSEHDYREATDDPA